MAGGHWRVEISGMDELMRGFARLPVAHKKRVKDRFTKTAEKAVAIARPLTPTEPDGGFLRDSLRAGRTIEQRDGTISSSLIAGGDVLKGSPALEGRKANVYATVQHDDTTLKHDDGGPKFAEKGAIQAAEDLVDRCLEDFDAAAKEVGLAR